MADYDLTLSDALMPELLGQLGGLAKLIEAVLNQVLDLFFA